MSPAEFFSNYTYATVFVGTTAIGITAGALGAFTYLQKQALISDVVAHSALPGTVGAFLVLTALGLPGLPGRSMVGLVIGAAIAGLIAMWLVHAIHQHSPTPLDTAMAVVLTGAFGIGLLLVQYIDRNPIPEKGGVSDYLFGNASTLTRADILVSLTVAALTFALLIVCWKEMVASSFDPQFAAFSGFSSSRTSAVTMVTAVAATVVGVKAVGLVLMVAFVITPAAIARQFSRSVRSMVCLAGLVGGVASAVGSYISVAYGPLPTGPVIVVTLAALFIASLLFSPRRARR